MSLCKAFRGNCKRNSPFLKDENFLEFWNITYKIMAIKTEGKMIYKLDLQFDVDIIVNKLWTVSIRSCCCFWRTELFTVAVTSCFSSSSMMEFCLDTNTWSWSFSSFIDRSWTICLSSMSSTFFSKKLIKGNNGYFSDCFMDIKSVS